jgi:hypothetical protein
MSNNLCMFWLWCVKKNNWIINDIPTSIGKVIYVWIYLYKIESNNVTVKINSRNKINHIL